MQQTGIRYLAEQLKYYDFEKSEQSYVFKISVAKFNELIERAKLIDKEQHQQTATHFFPTSLKKDNFEQYYNETYGQNRD